MLRELDELCLMNTPDWRPVISYGGRFTHYSASSLGEIRNDRTGKVLTATGAGRERKYLYVRLFDGKGRTCPLHVCVAEAFMGLRAGREINHMDGNQRNNAVSNFEYVSRLENKAHAVAHAQMGLVAWGEKHGHHKLTADAVREIRSFPWRTRGFIPRLMKKYGVSRNCITQVRTGHTWKHLDEHVVSSPAATQSTQLSKPR